MKDAGLVKKICKIGKPVIISYWLTKVDKINKAYRLSRNSDWKNVWKILLKKIRNIYIGIFCNFFCF